MKLNFERKKNYLSNTTIIAGFLALSVIYSNEINAQSTQPSSPDVPKVALDPRSQTLSDSREVYSFMMATPNERIKIVEDKIVAEERNLKIDLEDKTLTQETIDADRAEIERLKSQLNWLKRKLKEEEAKKAQERN